MGFFGGVAAFHGDEVLLIREKYERWENEHWNLPSGRIEEGETPETAAARELLEEAGVRVPLYDLELVSSIEIIREGHKISQSWNFTVTVTDPRLCPADPDGLVREARWFPRSQAVDHLAALPYPPIREAAMIFLRDGTRGLHWTFELPAGSDAFSDFTWQVPSAKRA